MTSLVNLKKIATEENLEGRSKMNRDKLCAELKKKGVDVDCSPTKKGSTGKKKSPPKEKESKKKTTPGDDNQIWSLWTLDENQKWKDEFTEGIVFNIGFKKDRDASNKFIAYMEKSILKGGETSDTHLYEILRKRAQKLFKKGMTGKAGGKKVFRENRRVKDLSFLLKDVSVPPVKSYLDVGASEGKITGEFGLFLSKRYGLSLDQIHGTDIVEQEKAYGNTQFEGGQAEVPIDFKVVDRTKPNHYDFPDESQSVITAMMALHHIEHVKKSIQDIFRMLEPGGLFIIREHDVQDPKMRLLLDLLHGFYAMVWPKEKEMDDFKEHFADYKSKEDWDTLMKEVGFVKVKETEPQYYWRYYYAVYQKPKGGKDFSKLTVKQLKEELKDRKIAFKSTLKKADLVALLEKEEEKEDEVFQVREHYNKIKNVRKEEKKILGLRKYNNWIKSCLIQEAAMEAVGGKKGLTILDLCCGKGGDMIKWQKLGAQRVVFCDIADKSLAEAKKRYEGLKGRKFKADFIEIDCFSNQVSQALKSVNAPKSEGKNSPRVKFDLVSCQFAIHYAFSEKERVDNLFQTVQENLKDNGVFVGTTTNARWLFENGRKSQSFGNSVYQVEFEEKLSKKVEGKPFGVGYTFSLANAVEDLKEYVVKPTVLKKQGEEADLDLIHISNFKKYEKELMKDEDFQKLRKIMKVEPLTKEEEPLTEAYIAFMFAFPPEEED